MVIRMRSFKGYTNVNTTEKIYRDATNMLEKSLNNPFVSSQCTIAPNGDMNNTFDTNVQIYQKWDSDGEAVKVIGRVNEIERGNYVYYDNQIWLVTTKPEDNGIYRKAEMQLCSAKFPIKENDKITVIGKDDLGRPIKEVTSGEIIMMPCVPKMNDASTAIAETNTAINKLANIITITIPYKEAPSIAHDEIFIMFNEQYRIIRIDPSKSIESIGILKITGERVGKEE